MAVNDSVGPMQTMKKKALILLLSMLKGGMIITNQSALEDVQYHIIYIFATGVSGWISNICSRRQNLIIADNSKRLL